VRPKAAQLVSYGVELGQRVCGGSAPAVSEAANQTSTATIREKRVKWGETDNRNGKMIIKGERK